MFLNGSMKTLFDKLKPAVFKSLFHEAVQWLNSDRLHWWLCLTSLAPLYHLVLLISVQAPLPLIVFSLVLWSVAWLPLEDSIPSLRLATPRRLGFLIGFLSITLLVIRGSLVQRYNDPFIVIFPVALALSLAVLCRPTSDLLLFREEIYTLSLMPILTWLPPLIPEQWLSRSGALFASIFLQIVGVNASQRGVAVSIGEATVTVAGPCSGNEMIAQAVVVAFLALIAFPMPRLLMRVPLFFLAPLFAWFANGLRIALLAFIAFLNPSSAVNDTGIFSFFHLGEGGILFSSVGIGLYAFTYVKILDRQLREKNI